MAPKPALLARREVPLVLLHKLADAHFVGKSPLDHILEAHDIVDMILQVLLRHDGADILYLFEVFGVEVIFPVEGNVASLDDEILPVLDGCLYDLLDDSS